MTKAEFEMWCRLNVALERETKAFLQEEIPSLVAELSEHSPEVAAAYEAWNNAASDFAQTCQKHVVSN
jgi:hypothetical protein